MKKVLLSGFDPFGEDDVNPSFEAVKRLNGRRTEDIEIVGIELPTVFQASTAALLAAVELYKPDVVIGVGLAGGRSQMTPERIAINIDDARIPDNRGNQPVDRPIAQDGPAAYWSTLPVKRIVRDMAAAGIPAAVSHSAGTFVCNHLFYGLMHYLHTQAPHIRGGFIHIPYLPGQVTSRLAPSMSLELMVKGLEIAAIAAADREADIAQTGGSLH